MKDIYVIDASGFLFRAYFAIRQMTNPQGKSTNALFGFIRSLLKLRKEFEPQHMVAVFDGQNNSAPRKAIYPEYKAHRQECPQDLGYQINWAKDFCEFMGIPHLDIAEVEADDAMGAVALWAEKKKANVFLCTSDKDMCQLVNDHIKILNTHKDNLLLGPKEVKENFGVRPDQIIDYLAIIGDSSDNVPGLPGFGPKTAATLLQEHDTLEHLLKHPETLKGKKRETLEQSADLARLSKRLVTLNTEVPVPSDEAFFTLKTPQTDKVKAFYQEMNFTSLLKEMGVDEAPKPSVKTSRHLVDDEESLKKLLKELESSQEICFDTETTAARPLLAELVGIGLSTDGKEVYYVPANGKIGLKRVLELLQPVFENPNIGFYGHNVKYDYHIMQNYGITIPRLSFDTIIASYVLNAHQRQHSLDFLAMERYGITKIALTDLIGKGKSATTMADVPIDQVCNYCCEDVEVTYRLRQDLGEELKERKLDQLFERLELPLIPVLAAMEREGIYLDKETTKKMSDEVGKEILLLEKEIYKLAGEEFNINSPKQLSVILFEKMGIKPPKKTATGYSTNIEVLETLSQDVPLAGKIIEYRTLAKLKSTYLDTLPKEINPNTHRIHCTFNQWVAATGRLSSQDPNLQNIPIRSEIGRKIRGGFKPEKKGWSYLSADYSQIELRLLAHLSEDPRLIQAFNNNQDIHRDTAAAIFEVPLDQVTSTQRYQAKAVNFGVIYGQQAFGLSRELGIDFKSAAAFIDAYFKKYSHVKGFIEECKQVARDKGKAITLTGRERLIPEITNKNPQIRNAAERLAINTPLQGTAADLIKYAMLRITDRIKEHQLKAKMILQIHDELIFELPDSEIETFKPLLREAMEKIWELKVPLVVDISVGKNWEQC